MKTLDMYGPFEYDLETINGIIPEGIIGNYALGHMENDSFIVEYVGRADKDLRKRIPHSIGKYTHFKVSQTSSPIEAYHKECINWHEFGGEENLLDNKIHPDRPDGVKLAFCPICAKRIIDKLNKRKNH